MDAASVKNISAPNNGYNRQWRLVKPIGNDQLPTENDFQLSESSIPEPQQDEYLVRTICLGTSPAQRAYINASASMHQKVNAGEVMRGRGVGVVVKSKSPKFATGDVVVGSTGWQDYSLHRGNQSGPYATTRIHDPLSPYSLALGILGSAGVTAYFGLLDVGKLKKGHTVLISAAAGGVGSCAAQIAKKLGCRVIGIAGGPAKCAWLQDTIGIDATIDYKNEDLASALSTHCPNGVDVFFDNVGGEQLNTALMHLAMGARIVICGYIATDYKDHENQGPDNYVQLLRQRASMRGYFVFDYSHKFSKAERKLKRWYRQGKLIDNTDMVYGLENMPNALQSLFVGGNCGVRLCQVAADPKLNSII